MEYFYLVNESESVPYAEGEVLVNIPWLCDRSEMIHGQFELGHEDRYTENG